LRKRLSNIDIREEEAASEDPIAVVGTTAFFSRNISKILRFTISVALILPKIAKT
jgi:hypothetical protein